MILNLEIDTKQLTTNLNELVAGLETLVSPQALDAISRATFSIKGQRFVVAADAYARANPKKMHHVYEWGKVGDKTARLFVLERSVIIDGRLVIGTKFLKSRVPVPINPQLLKAGITGKVVSRKSIFANKAEVMEAGTPVSFTAKRVLSIVGNNGLAFIAPGTTVHILHPGGLQTRQAFASYMVEWYTKKAGAVMDASGFYQKISTSVAKALTLKNTGPSQVLAAVIMVADQYDTGGIIK